MEIYIIRWKCDNAEETYDTKSERSCRINTLENQGYTMGVDFELDMCLDITSEKEEEGFQAIGNLIAMGAFPESVLEQCGFPYYDQWITDPTIDSSARFPLSKRESIRMYGKNNVENFISGILKWLTEDNK